MARRTILTLISILTLTFSSQLPTLAQDQTSIVNLKPAGPTPRWDYASLIAPPGRKIFVITMAQPTRRITCRVSSFTVDQLICKRHFGKTRIYKPQEVAALVAAGDNNVRKEMLLILNGGSGVAAWGTYILASTCIPCAVVTGVVAFALFASSGAVLMGDGQPEAVFYLAPGQKFQAKLH